MLKFGLILGLLSMLLLGGCARQPSFARAEEGTLTPEISATPSETASPSETPAPTATRTGHPLHLPLIIKDFTPTPTFTVTPSPTLTPTQTPTPTVTPSVTPTPTAITLNFCDTQTHPILYADPITVTRNINYNGSLQHLQVLLQATHTWVGDLKIELRHAPDGRKITLLERVGTPPNYCSGDNIDTILDDGAAQSAQTACNAVPPALSGLLRPKNALNAFEGINPHGEWQLIVQDLASGDEGELTQWCLITQVR